MSTPELKERAAQHAVAAELKSGMCVGLGSGSTAACAVNALGKALQDGTLQAIIGVPTSEATARQAVALGIPLRELHEVEGLDVTIDGADEVDPALNLIKGLGGALTREKMVAQATTGRYVVVADESKVVTGLGQHAPLPVEVLPFGWRFKHSGWPASAPCRACAWPMAPLSSRTTATTSLTAPFPTGSMIRNCWNGC